MVSDDEWNTKVLIAEYREDVPALLMKKSDLFRHFSEEGALLSMIELLVVGDIAILTQVFECHGLDVVICCHFSIKLE